VKPQSTLAEFLLKQIDVEERIVQSLNTAAEEMPNPAVRTTLKAISFDSAKHAEMYKAAAKLLEGAPVALSQELTHVDLDNQRRLVEDHVRMEAELIDQLTARMPHLENKKVELLLSAILQDERKHHKLLKRIVDILVRGETVTDEWWDLLREESVPRW
jgi:rubrerythrin